MADTQIGTRFGYQEVGNPAALLLSDITADGVNTVTVSDLSKIVVGQNIDITNKATGAVLASNRQVTNLTSAGVLTYSGADVAAVAGTHGVFPVGAFATPPRSNVNGGYSDRGGHSDASLSSVDAMITRLQIQNATYYTNARIASMTVNDLVYAIRQIDGPSGIR